MADLFIQPLSPDYRGGSGGVEIFLPARAVQLPGKKRLVSWFWILIAVYMGLIGAVYYATHHGHIDEFLGSMLLIAMMFPLIMLSGGFASGRGRGGSGRGGGGGGWGRGGSSAGYSGSSDIALPEAGMKRGELVNRKNQRLLLAPTCTREVYQEGSQARFRTSFEFPKGARLEVRDDADGDKTGEYFSEFWLIAPDGEDRLLIERVAPSERGEVLAALSRAFDGLNG